MSNENPYTRLKRACLKWAQSVYSPEKKLLWLYKKSDFDKQVNLYFLYERVGAADDLGYDVRLESRSDGLQVVYVKRPDQPPRLLNG